MYPGLDAARKRWLVDESTSRREGGNNCRVLAAILDILQRQNFRTADGKLPGSPEEERSPRHSRLLDNMHKPLHSS